MVIDQTGLKLWWDVHILRRAANASIYSTARSDRHPINPERDRKGAIVHSRQPTGVSGDLSPEDLERLFIEGEARLRGGSDTKFVLDTSQP